MISGRITVPILLTTLLFIGCGDHPDAVQAAKFRKNGEHQKAYDLIIQSLAESHTDLEIWRELAFADLKMKDLADSDVQSYKHLVEASVLSAAVLKADKSDHLWDGIANLSSQALRLDANDAMAQITVSRKAMFGEGGSTDSRLLDMDLAEAVVRRCQFDFQLLTLLSKKSSDSNEMTLKQIEEKFSDWGKYTELTPERIQQIRDRANKHFDEFYAPIQRELSENGEFSVELVIQRKLRP